MKSKNLKITAGSFVAESELSKPAKLQMLNFIQHEATDHQLMALLLDGEIVELDEQAEQIVEDRFNVQEGLFSAQFKVKKDVGKGMMDLLKICMKKSKSSGMSFQKRDLLCTLEARKYAIKKLKSSISFCSKEKDINKCKKSLKTAIENHQREIPLLQQNIKSL